MPLVLGAAAMVGARLRRLGSEVGGLADAVGGQRPADQGIGLTGVGGSTIGATEAAEALTGRPLTPESIEAAADLAAQAARPRTDHRGSAEYKRHMVRTFVIRILSRTDTAPGAVPDTGDSAERAA